MTRVRWAWMGTLAVASGFWIVVAHLVATLG